MEELLQQFEANLTQLIRDKNSLAEENHSLRLTIENQREELIRTHEELAKLKKQNRTLQTANAMAGVGEEDRAVAKRRINRLIELVDRTMAQLTENTPAQ